MISDCNNVCVDDMNDNLLYSEESDDDGARSNVDRDSVAQNVHANHCDKVDMYSGV